MCTLYYSEILVICTRNISVHGHHMLSYFIIGFFISLASMQSFNVYICILCMVYIYCMCVHMLYGVHILYVCTYAVWCIYIVYVHICCITYTYYMHAYKHEKYVCLYYTLNKLLHFKLYGVNVHSVQTSIVQR